MGKAEQESVTTTINARAEASKDSGLNYNCGPRKPKRVSLWCDSSYDHQSKTAVCVVADFKGDVLERKIYDDVKSNSVAEKMAVSLAVEAAQKRGYDKLMRVRILTDCKTAARINFGIKNILVEWQTRENNKAHLEAYRTLKTVRESRKNYYSLKNLKLPRVTSSKFADQQNHWLKEKDFAWAVALWKINSDYLKLAVLHYGDPSKKSTPRHVVAHNDRFVFDAQGKHPSKEFFAKALDYDKDLAPKQAARILHVSRDRQAESEAEQIINDLIEADKNYQNNS